jgi:hypothetical protein
MRVGDGCFKVKEDRNGTQYFLHRLTNVPRPDLPALVRPAGAEPQRADGDTLNAGNTLAECS